MICIACVWRNNLLTWFDMSLDRLMSFFGSLRWSSTYSFWGTWNRIGRCLTSCSLRGRNLRHVWDLFWRMSGKDFDEFSLAEACFLFIDDIVIRIHVYQSKNDFPFFVKKHPQQKLWNVPISNPEATTEWKPRSPRLRTLYLLKGQVQFFLRPNQRLGGWWKSWSHIWVKDFFGPNPHEWELQ